MTSLEKLCFRVLACVGDVLISHCRRSKSIELSEPTEAKVSCSVLNLGQVKYRGVMRV